MTLLNSYGAGAWMGVSAKDQGRNGKEIRWNGWEQEIKVGQNTGERKRLQVAKKYNTTEGKKQEAGKLLLLQIGWC